ncbi:c-type cytochrome domain-containing protein [Anatilimnocola aggregata]|nr:c-type cytochrome domain-containing protein [Anatilimnocola aggregata]QDU96550.1 Planctomycete cytochrome C [Lignipirellula cremea]
MARWRTLGLLCVTLLTVESAFAEQPLESAYADKVVPFLKRHCISCHGAEKPKGDVRFDGPAPDLTDPKVSEKWRMARRMLAQGEMPPEGKPRPSADELLAAMNWIEDAAARAAVVTRGGVGRRDRRAGSGNRARSSQGIGRCVGQVIP